MAEGAATAMADQPVTTPPAEGISISLLAAAKTAIDDTIDDAINDAIDGTTMSTISDEYYKPGRIDRLPSQPNLD